MKTNQLIAALLLGAFLLSPAFSPAAARGDTAEASFAKGKQLVAQGDFEGALKAYSNAARTDRENDVYMKQFTVIRQVLALRKRFTTEESPAKWQRIAITLHSYYLREKAYGEALTLDTKVNEKLANSLSASLLAQTQLAMGKNAEAFKTLESLGSEKATWSTQAMQVIALARDGKKAEAKKLAATVELPEKICASKGYTIARMKAAAGDAKDSLELLTACVEATPPSRLEAYKAKIKACPDFADIAKTEGFAKVMAAESKAKESGCSGGSSCAGCPSRGSCSSSKKAE